MILFFWLSVALLIGAVLCAVWLFRKKKNLTKGLLTALALLFGSVVAMRMAAGGYLSTGAFEAASEYARLSGFQVILDSVVHGLQSFSMDEDYTMYLFAVQDMCLELFRLPWTAELAGMVSAVQNVLAPVAGGAVLLDILANIFPAVKLALKKGKQQINAFCLRHGYHYEKTKWTIAHLKWLKQLDMPALYRETLDEYMASYEEQTAKIERFDKRIEELASHERYQEKVKKLGCFLGIKTHTALSLIVETGDFDRFAKGNVYAAYLGLAPGERSSSDNINRLGITKAGNQHLRVLLIEAAGGICKGAVGHKSKDLRQRQNGNPADVIAYADKANTRLRSRYYKFIRHGKKRNVAVAAIARELACFIWGMMTGNISMRKTA